MSNSSYFVVLIDSTSRQGQDDRKGRLYHTRKETISLRVLVELY